MKAIWQGAAVAIVALVVLQQAALILPKLLPSLAVLVMLIVVLRLAWKWTDRHY